MSFSGTASDLAILEHAEYLRVGRCEIVTRLEPQLCTDCPPGQQRLGHLQILTTLGKDGVGVCRKSFEPAGVFSIGVVTSLQCAAGWR